MQLPLTLLITSGNDRFEPIQQLRYEVLRQPLGGSYESAKFHGDDFASTVHFRFVAESTEFSRSDLASPNSGDHFQNAEQHPAVACATLMESDPPAQIRALIGSGNDFRQLRGMAVSEVLRGSGIGSKLLLEIHHYADISQPKELLWCNAREGAVPFYEKMGWRTAGEMFEIKGVGAHIAMCRF